MKEEENEPKIRVSEEQKKHARKAFIAHYLIENGEPLERVGERYRHKEHDSLVFTGNGYYWNKTGETGNGIDYLMRHKGMDFITAVLELTNTPSANGRAGEQKLIEEFSFSDLKLELKMNRAIAYLNKHRGIDYQIIKWLLKNNLLYQEQGSNNIIFPMYDEKGAIVGADLHGTLTDEEFRFKKIATGSKYGHGYNVNPSQSKTIKFLLFFESSIDLLSFWDIKKSENKDLRDCLLISMAGLKDNIVKHYLNAFTSSVEPVFCVDNDNAGLDFIKTISEQIKDVKTLLPRTEYKDWNDQLKIMRGLSK